MSDDLKARMRQVARSAPAGEGVDAVVAAMQAEHAAEIAPLVEALERLSRVVIQETEGYTFGKPGYDITLDHLHEEAQMARAALAQLRRWFGEAVSARTNAREAAVSQCLDGTQARRAADAAFDSVLASLDTPEMRDVVGAMLDAHWYEDKCPTGHDVLAAIRAELTKEP